MQAVSCKVATWFKQQMGCFQKKSLPTGRRNVRLRKQYLSFVETAPAAAFIFIMRWTSSHCELPAAAQGRIFLILPTPHHQCYYNNSLTLNLILILLTYSELIQSPGPKALNHRFSNKV